MKNIHILPTDKPSRLHKFGDDLGLTNEPTNNPFAKQQNIYITSDEEIKGGDWVYYLHNSGLHDPSIHKVVKPNYSDYKPYSIHFTSGFGVKEDCKKIIITTDQDLIKYGVQSIDNEFLEWLVENKSCEQVEIEKIEDELISPKNPKIRFNALQDPPSFISAESLNNMIITYKYKIIIPKEEPKQVCENCKKEISEWGCACGKQVEPKQETLEEAMNQNGYHESDYDKIWREGVEFGAKWQEEQDKDVYLNGYVDGSRAQAKLMYNDEDMAESFMACWKANVPEGFECKLSFNEWFEQFKKK